MRLIAYAEDFPGHMTEVQQFFFQSFDLEMGTGLSFPVHLKFTTDKALNCIIPRIWLMSFIMR